ncbi:uncharacterized protein LOC116851994 [Odontomachus brunneus]|uniref:uncharacterized protein LOC116851994 n=1 Tax=Odontomachus brunneus TaxID=486640 RepID=UPI0013F18118|nr:uncharacterized protein LOC116851994 [Odontomachus brunneus]
MISIEVQYFSVSKNLLLAIGLWPYQQTRITQLQYTLFLSILLLAIMCHFTTFITTECTLDIVIKVLSSMSIFLNFAIQYSSFRMNTATVKIVLEELQHICGKIKDENELAIIKKYGNISKRYTVWLTTSAIFGEIALILIQFWSSILDFVQPRNEFRSRISLFPMEYFVDHHRYFYLIMLHSNAAVCIGITTMLATGTLFIACQKCVCGLFMVASYRIKHAISTNQVTPRGRNLTFLRITKAVKVHRRAMKFSQFLVTKFEVMLGTTILFGISSFSLNLFRIFSIASSNCRNIKELMLSVGYAAIIAMYIFLANYIGQDLTDHNRRVFITAYNVHWYKTPVTVQKLILFLLQRGTKDFTLNIGKLIHVSLECFASLANTSISYFTVLYTTQK